MRLPTEKAHGLTIVKSCDAFARAGAAVTLVIPRRKTHIQTDIFETYGVGKTFSVCTVPTIDWLYTHGQTASWLASLIFAYGVFFLLLFLPKKGSVIYTREISLLPLHIVGMPAILESHHVFAKRTLYFALARAAQGIVVISQALKRTFVRIGFRENTIIVEPSGVDLATFSIATPRAEARAMLALPIETPVIVYTGNFTTMGADKGIHDILHAMQRVKHALFVAAGGSTTDIKHYQAEAEALGVAAQVRFVGFMPQSLLAQYQCAADILLMPFPDMPHYRNNMSPVKMFEYMASGRPIIATDLPTIREVLNEENAVLIPPGDSDALACTVHTLLNDPTLGERLAQRAKKDVSRYEWSERSRRILDFIQDRS
ncbi:glycosyltransferase [Candidatus Kaiserbacteria bacterium]|nr:glycosyltransferase [Candidatus Kaiserbacteria bacterium]